MWGERNCCFFSLSFRRFGFLGTLKRLTFYTCFAISGAFGRVKNCSKHLKKIQCSLVLVLLGSVDCSSLGGGRLFLIAIVLFGGIRCALSSGIGRFNNLTIDDGLSQGFVSAICQDEQGYIWIGTMGGLNRYDGYSFKIFKHSLSDQSSLSDDMITCLFVDRSGGLWVGTRNGLNAYDEKNSDI